MGEEGTLKKRDLGFDAICRILKRQELKNNNLKVGLGVVSLHGLNGSKCIFCDGYCVVTLYHKAHFLIEKAPDLENRSAQ